MFRSLCSCVVAAAFLISSTSGAVAASWQHMYNMQSDPLYGLLDENEMAGMAYLKVPFGGPISKRNKAVWGVSLISRLPYELSHVRLGNRRGLATILDLRFDGSHVDDFQVNGLSMKQSYRQLNAAGDQRSSPWMTYGLMLLAVGAATAVILIGVGKDKVDSVPRVPGRGGGFGCGDGQGPGGGDAQGDGTQGSSDPRVIEGTCSGDVPDETDPEPEPEGDPA